jgi:hypothetical protein
MSARFHHFPSAKSGRESAAHLQPSRNRPQQRKTAMGTRADYAYGNSNYLKAETLAGKTIRVIISDVEDVEFEKGLKPVLSFEGKEKSYPSTPRTLTLWPQTSVLAQRIGSAT